MNSQNSLSHIILAYKKTSFAFIFFISFTLLSFKTQNVEALFIPTLSASVDNTAASVNGNQVINSTNKTIEIPLNLTINTNNRTGYTATLSAETENTALTNNNSTTGAKIDSVSTNLPLGNLPNNSWGYKFGSSTNYAPIPALSTPAQILQTSGKTNGNESNQLSIGMKLSDNLESGRYTNKLIFSILTNNYDRIAVITEGPDFNTKLKALETATNKIEHFKKSTVAPTASMNVVNIEDEESDDEIKLWLDPTDKTAYYYAETEKVYLNANTSKMFDRMTNLATLDLSNFDTSKVTNMRFMFSDIPNLTTLNLSNFDTSNVTNMGAMFRGVSNLTTLNLSNFDTSKVTNMGSMFFHASNLTTLNLSNFDTSKVMYMNSMFSNMYNLTALNLSSFDTSNVIDMGYMFSDVSNLINLNLSNFDTSKVTDMSGMFSGMSNLTTIDLSNFNTSQVTAMNHMFYDMSNLITLNLSNFDTSKVTNLSFMFYLPDENKSKDKLEKIYVNNDFDTTKLTNFSGMFINREKLRGGNGSYLADPRQADKSWLRIDRPGAPGYFTRKP